MSNIMETKLNSATPEPPAKARMMDSKKEPTARETGEKMGEMYLSLTDKSADYVKSVRNYVRQNPVRSLMMAVAAGTVVGGFFAAITQSRKH